MRKYFLAAFACLFLCLFLSFASLAQTNVAAPPTFHFVAGGSAIGFSGSGSGSQIGSIAYTGLQLTSTVTVTYEHLTVPNISYRGELGVASYTRPLSALLGKTLAGKFLFNTDDINVTFAGGAGKAVTAKGTGLAETVGASLSYPIPGSSAAIQIIGYSYVHGGGINGLVTRNQQIASSGLLVYF